MATAHANNPPSPSPYAVQSARLSGRGRALVEALLRKHPRTERAVGMYLEAMAALERTDSLESIHVAAYELREFMGALPVVLEVPQAPYDHMKTKVNELAERWEASSTKSTAWQNGDWNGDVDSHLRRILRHLSDLVTWWRTNVPRRRDEVKATIRVLLPTDRPLPDVVWDLRAKHWSELLRYFNNVTHHETRPARTDFMDRVGALEQFLLEHLEPRTFEDQDEIDALLAEAGGSA